MRRLRGLAAAFSPPRLALRYSEPGRVQTRCYLHNYPRGAVIETRQAPRKTNSPTVVLPDVLLDLDAEDSPHVRPFQERDAQTQRSQWGYDPAVDSAVEFVKEMKKLSADGLRKMHEAEEHPSSETHISDHDIMTVALLGGSNVLNMLRKDEAPPGERTIMRRAIRKNGIPDPILSLDANRVLPFLLRRQTQASAALRDLAQRAEESTKGRRQYALFKRDVKRCPNLSSLKKLYSHNDSPKSGLDVSADITKLVHECLLSMVQSAEDNSTIEDILKFVNNLTIKSLVADKEIARRMTLFGLQLSSLLGLLPCILQYLEICLSMGFIAHDTEGVAKSRFQATQALLSALKGGDGAARGIRPKIFTMLTGRDTSNSEVQPSLLGLAMEGGGQVSEISELGVRILGELGAVRLLWHHRSGADDELLGQAFLRCAQLLGGVKDGGLKVDFVTTTGEVGRDAVLDFQTVNAIEASYIARHRRLPKPSLSRLEKRISKKEITDVFRQTDLSEAMARFKTLVDVAANVKASADDQVSETFEDEQTPLVTSTKTQISAEAIPTINVQDTVERNE